MQTTVALERLQPRISLAMSATTQTRTTPIAMSTAQRLRIGTQARAMAVVLATTGYSNHVQLTLLLRRCRALLCLQPLETGCLTIEREQHSGLYLLRGSIEILHDKHVVR